MLKVDIPGFKSLALEHLVLGFNGVMAIDGKLVVGIEERIQEISRLVKVHVLTADAFGTARARMEGLDVTVHVLAAEGQDVAKQAYVESLGPERVACIGNGRNDRLMLKAASLAIAVAHMEGLALEAAQASHLMVSEIDDALELLLSPRRLIATLRA